MLIHIRGDDKDYAIDGITKSMTFEDVFNKFVNTCRTRYGYRLKSIKFQHLQFIAEGYGPIPDEWCKKTLEEFRSQFQNKFLHMI